MYTFYSYLDGHNIDFQSFYLTNLTANKYMYIDFNIA